MTAPEPQHRFAERGSAPGGAAEEEEMATATTREKIEAVIDEIRPAVRADGGDVVLVDFDQEEGRVELRLMGACHACPYSLQTLKAGIEHRLRIQLPEVKSVVAL